MKFPLHISLWISAIFISAFSYGQIIKTNQIGFQSEGPKIGIVPETESSQFNIIDKTTNQVVYTGTLGVVKKDGNSGERVSVAEFSEFKTPGTYVVSVDEMESYPFQISDNKVYTKLSKSTVKAFYYWRSSTAIEAQYAQEGEYNFARGFGHPDTKAIIHSSAADESRAEGEIFSSPKGWYDAGDYNKYVVNAAPAVFSLLHAYELNPDYYKLLDLNIPESNNNIPDILDEVKWETDWLFTMQDPNDGGVYFKLTYKSFGGIILPEDDNRTDRYFMKKTTNSSLNFAAMMAKASRIFGQFPELETYADSCLASAIKAYEWAVANPSVTYRNPSDIKTGEYGDATTDDEFFYAQAELFLATKESKYFEALNLGRSFSNPSWPHVETLGLLSLAAQLENISIDSIAKATIKLKLTQLASSSYNYSRNNAYRAPTPDFYWGSNGNVAFRGLVGYAAFLLSGDEDHYTLAQFALNYLLGQNALAHSFVSGFGTKHSKHQHDRRMEADGINAPIPGYVSGGPNSNPASDCPSTAYPSPYPAKKFADLKCSYSTNEIAINWNGPLAFLAGALDARYTNLQINPLTAISNSKGTTIAIIYEDVVYLSSFTPDAFTVSQNDDTLTVDSINFASDTVLLFMKDTIKAKHDRLFLNYKGSNITDKKGNSVAQFDSLYIFNYVAKAPAYFINAEVKPTGDSTILRFSKAIDVESFTTSIVELSKAGDRLAITFSQTPNDNEIVLLSNKIHREDFLKLTLLEGAKALDGGTVFPGEYVNQIINNSHPYPPIPSSANIAVHGYTITVSFDKKIEKTDSAGIWQATVISANDSTTYIPDGVYPGPDFVDLSFTNRFSAVDTVYISHSGNDFVSEFNATLSPFSYLKVYNELPTPEGAAYVIDTATTTQIEMENFWYNSGYQTEDCTEGGLNIGYTEKGDWADYLIDVQTTGTYQIHFRTASETTASSLKLLSVVDKHTEKLEQYTMKNTGGWQSWTTIEGTIELEAGEQYLRVEALGDSYNLNWIKIGTSLESPTNIPTPKHIVSLSPNPTTGDVIYCSGLSEEANYSIYNQSGITVSQGITSEAIHLKEISKGMYYVQLITNRGIQTIPFIKN